MIQELLKQQKQKIIIVNDVEKEVGLLLESKTWVTAKREFIHISRMETRHIKNCIRCLKGQSKTKIPFNWNGKTHDKWIELFEDELSNR